MMMMIARKTNKDNIGILAIIGLKPYCKK